MQCGSCFKFFSYPSSDNADKECYMYCPSCRSSSNYDYAYTAKGYEHQDLTEMFFIGDED